MVKATDPELGDDFPIVLPPSVFEKALRETYAGGEPIWLTWAKREIGFKEKGHNRGIEKYLMPAKTGQLGDPWCAIFANAGFEINGIHGTRSALARSFTWTPEHFVKLTGPALGAVTPMWRGSPSGTQGHVFFYVGTDADGREWGIGGNENDGVYFSPHDAHRVLGHYWPRSLALPKVGIIRVTAKGGVVGSET